MGPMAKNPGRWRADRHSVPANRHHGCQLEETKISVRRRFLGSSSDKVSTYLCIQMGVPEIKSNRSHPLLCRDALWRTWSIATVLDRLRRSES
jgi:hypothetical protein